MSRIFISYSRKDEEFARKLARSLSELGANIWIDVQDIPAGMKWSTAIQQGLNVCEVMLLVVSPDSMASTNVEDEWQHYFDKRKPVIPIRWRPAEVHFQLNRIQYVDFHEEPYDTAFDRLIAALREKGAVFAQNDGQTNSHLTATSNSKPQDTQTILPPPFAWCPVTAGQVTLAAGGYVPAGGKTFPVAAFEMAKYPVTNAQYDLFVRDGYADPRWWNYSPEAQGWRMEHPESSDTAFPGDDLPRTNVSWYDAVAFCRWLSATLSPPLPTGRTPSPLLGEGQSCCRRSSSGSGRHKAMMDEPIPGEQNLTKAAATFILRVQHR